MQAFSRWFITAAVTHRPQAWRGAKLTLPRSNVFPIWASKSPLLVAALEDLPLFKGIPIHVFIAGRSIRDAASPVEAARQFKRSIAELWG